MKEEIACFVLAAVEAVEVGGVAQEGEAVGVRAWVGELEGGLVGFTVELAGDNGGCAEGERKEQKE